MGMVYTFEQIKRGKVPHESDFVAIAEMLRGAARTEFSILGAVICGSVIRKDHTRRSDIDCFVLYDGAKALRARTWMQATAFAAQAVSVPLTFIPVNSSVAKTRMHSIGPSFRKHLARSAKAGGLIKGNPLQALAPTVEVRAETESYFRTKYYNLDEAFSNVMTFSEERRASYLKKLLEAPMHIARKVLAVTERLEDDSKQYVREAYSALMPPAMHEQFEYCIELENTYGAELFSQLDSPDEERYAKLIRDLIDSSDAVLGFLEANILYLENLAR